MTLIAALCALFFLALAVGALAMILAPARVTPALLAITGALASVAALAAAALALAAASPPALRLWTLPRWGALTLTIDRTSGVFLLAAALVFLPVFLFSAGYMRRYAGRYSLKAMGMMLHSLFASIALVLTAADVVSFLLSWETMTILAYLLVSYDHEQEESVASAFVYLSMAEVGTVAVAVAFLVLAAHAGSFDFAGLKAAAGGLGAGARWTVFLLTFFGFGVKAGLVPVNAWLPRAHPVAPANASAVLSGVILNLGLYGILRTNIGILPAAGGPGLVVMGIGGLSALIGILYATIDRDLKAMLAHSSIENIGIVTVGFGAGIVFSAYGRPGLSAIALVASLYHMVNHSVSKSLLFMAAGSVDAGTGTRDLDRLGGLAKVLPLTSVLFLAGALSLAAIPPFAGFASEWLTLQSLLRVAELKPLGVKIVFVLVGVSLALTAALAITCFAKAFAMTFLGKARTAEAGSASERRGATALALGLPALLCLLLGVLPTYVVPALDRTVQPLVSASAAESLVPPFFRARTEPGALPADFEREFRALGAEVGARILPGRGLVLLHRDASDGHVVFAMSPSYLVAVLLLIVAAAALALRAARGRRRIRRAAAWAGGTRRLLPGMTYTASGFSAPVQVIFRAVFRPTVVEDSREAVLEHFRTSITRRSEEVHLVRRAFVDPIVRGVRVLSRALARIHNGSINTYMIYVLLTLLVVLLFAG